LTQISLAYPTCAIAHKHRVPAIRGGCWSMARSGSTVGGTQSSSRIGCMGPKRLRKGIFHPRSGRGVFTAELDVQCDQETDLAMELSREIVDNETSWAILESRRQELDEEMTAEALAWSYERPSPRGSLIDRLKLDLSKSGSWNPTLLTQREALRLPVGMRSACLPGEPSLPRKVSSIRKKHQQATGHTEHMVGDWRGRYRVSSMVTKVAAVSRMNRPFVGKDWTKIIGPERSPNPMVPKLQLPGYELNIESADVFSRRVSESSALMDLNKTGDNTDTLDRI